MLVYNLPWCACASQELHTGKEQAVLGTFLNCCVIGLEDAQVVWERWNHSSFTCVILSAEFLPWNHCRRTPGLQLHPQRRSFRMIYLWQLWEMMKFHWTLMMASEDVPSYGLRGETAALTLVPSLSPGAQGQPHWGSSPVTSAGGSPMLAEWASKGRPTKLIKLSQFVSGPGSSCVTSSGAADGAERSIWGLEVKSESHHHAQAQIQEGD